jgi:hypothetical protein
MRAVFIHIPYIKKLMYTPALRDSEKTLLRISFAAILVLA